MITPTTGGATPGLYSLAPAPGRSSPPPPTPPAASRTNAPAASVRGTKTFLSKAMSVFLSKTDMAIREIKARLKEYEASPTTELGQTIVALHRQLLDAAPPASLDGSYGRHQSVEMDNPEGMKFLEKISPISRQVEKIRSEIDMAPDRAS